MFESLKKRVNSVLQEGLALSENFSNTYIRPSPTGQPSDPFNNTVFNTTPLSSPSPSTSSSASSSHRKSTAAANSTIEFPAHLNIQAGVPLLASKERTWQQLHAAADRNARLAERIDSDIQHVMLASQRNATAVSDMQHSLNEVPSLVGKLAECGRMLKDIGELCVRLDEALFGLEDVMEEVELQERKLQLDIEMAVYREAKMGMWFWGELNMNSSLVISAYVLTVELERVRRRLADEHAAKQRQHEQRLRSVQIERQAVFQEQFQEDLRCYQRLGTIPSE